MKWVRKLHVYTGFLMLPFLFIYGISALLYNHPTWFRFDEPETSSETWETRSPQFETLSRPELLERELKAAMAELGLDSVEPIPNVSPRLLGVYSYHADDGTELLQLAVTPRGLRVSFTRQDNSQQRYQLLQPIGREWMESGDSAALQMLVDEGALEENFARQSTPDLETEMRVNGQHKIVHYDFDRGSLSLSDPVDNSPGFRQFTQRLHTSFRYRDGDTRGNIWAAVVDFLCFSIFFWVISGLFLGWQSRERRRLLLVMLAGVTVFTTAILTWMYRGMAAS